MTYSYDPEKAKENGIDRMRLELGDTQFNPAELTAALSDEEYAAIIDMNPGWKKAKLKCVEAILMKFSHQTDMKVGPVSYDFSDRINFWKTIYDNLKGSSIGGIPVLYGSVGGKIEGKMYFHEDMQTNPRKVKI
ncbi:MAG: hypothetical protein Q4G33_04580 [bacterium]|nr:hypothetical protein [bacterium]